MRRLLKGEGWAEMLFAGIAVSVITGWLVTVQCARLGAPTRWEAWPSQQEPVAVKRVAATTTTPVRMETSSALAAP